MMPLEEARKLLDLAPKATKQEIRAAYRRAARLWHPDRAPAGEEAPFRVRMQQVNAAYQRIVQFIEAYRFELVESAGPADLHKWWADRFYTGVWSPPPPQRSRRRQRLMATRVLLVLVIFFHLGLAKVEAAATLPDTREDLVYQVSLGPWDDVAKVHLVLKELEPGHYLAEFSGAAQGMWRLLSRYLPERYQSEMVYREGRLKPLVYREEFMDKGQHWVKEYRFDYERRLLTLRRQIDGGKWVKKWEVPLNEPVYDLLSLFYNVRIGAFGTLRGGSNVRVAVLPNPKPQELHFRIGEKSDQGLKVLLNFRQPDSPTEDHYYLFINPQGVPTLAWTPVIFFGKLAGRLLNPGEIKKDVLPAVALQH